jgi:hypothetical protein
MNVDVWLLYLSNNKNLGLIPHDLNYFQTHFIGQPMAANWQPPPVTVSGKSKRLQDFVSWMYKAPVCSEKAKTCLEPVIGDYVEFLLLTHIKEKPYFAINVLKVVDCLDKDNSDLVYSSSEPGYIRNVETYGFIPDRLEHVPIFKVPLTVSSVFVTRDFVDVVINNKLWGAKFADPSINSWEYVFGRKSANTVPGVFD